MHLQYITVRIFIQLSIILTIVLSQEYVIMHHEEF